jgi:hypothetical protein
MGFTTTTKLVVFGNPVQAAARGNQKSVRELAIGVTDRTKAYCPVDKARLRNSYMAVFAGGEQYGFNDSGGQPATDRISWRTNNAQEAMVGTAQRAETRPGVFDGDVYGPYVEFGTRRMAPQPHIRPAIQIEVLGGKALDVIRARQAEHMRGALKGYRIVEGDLGGARVVDELRESFGLGGV